MKAVFVGRASPHQAGQIELQDESENFIAKLILRRIYDVPYWFLSEVIRAVYSCTKTYEHVTGGLFTSRGSKVQRCLLFYEEVYLTHVNKPESSRS